MLNAFLDLLLVSLHSPRHLPSDKLGGGIGPNRYLEEGERDEPQREGEELTSSAIRVLSCWR
jgi:hypothetical protein